MLEAALAGIATGVVKSALAHGVGAAALKAFSVYSTFSDLHTLGGCLLAKADSDSLRVVGAELLMSNITAGATRALLDAGRHRFEVEHSPAGLVIRSGLVRGDLHASYAPHLIRGREVSLVAMRSVVLVAPPPLVQIHGRGPTLLTGGAARLLNPDYKKGGR